MLWLSTCLPVLERFRGWIWYSYITLFLGGLYSGGLIFWGAYIRDFTVCHLKRVINFEHKYLNPQNVPHMYMIKEKSFRPEKTIVKSWLENFWPKSEKLGKIWIFSMWEFEIQNVLYMYISTCKAWCGPTPRM